MKKQTNEFNARKICILIVKRRTSSIRVAYLQILAAFARELVDGARYRLHPHRARGIGETGEHLVRRSGRGARVLHRASSFKDSKPSLAAAAAATTVEGEKRTGERRLLLRTNGSQRLGRAGDPIYLRKVEWQPNNGPITAKKPNNSTQMSKTPNLGYLTFHHYNQ